MVCRSIGLEKKPDCSDDVSSVKRRRWEQPLDIPPPQPWCPRKLSRTEVEAALVLQRDLSLEPVAASLAVIMRLAFSRAFGSCGSYGTVALRLKGALLSAFFASSMEIQKSAFARTERN